LQVLQPLIDPTFSQHSHGFRPGRRARDAVLAAQQHVQNGLVAKNSRRWWRNSRMALNNVLTIAYFDRLGMPRLT
jgi:retron-type reverse transcriptase